MYYVPQLGLRHRTVVSFEGVELGKFYQEMVLSGLMGRRTFSFHLMRRFQ